MKKIFSFLVAIVILSSIHWATTHATETHSGNFPTTLNNFQDNDIINAGDWNNIEDTIGITNSASTTSHDYMIRNSTTSVGRGGTGTTTLTANNVILGNGTSSVLFVAPGDSGNLLTSNGTTWQSSAAPLSSVKPQDHNILEMYVKDYRLGTAPSTTRNLFFDAFSDTAKYTSITNLTIANNSSSLSGSNLGGSYVSTTTIEQGNINSIALWLQYQGATSTYLAVGDTSSTIVVLHGNRTTNDFAANDWVNVYNRYNTVRERKQISAIAYDSTNDETNITLSSALSNVYPSSSISTAAWIQKVPMIPELSIVDVTGTIAYASTTYSRSYVLSNSYFQYATSSPNTSGTRAYYKLNDTTDSSGNGYTLTNTGSATFAKGYSQNAVTLGASNSTKYLSIANDLGITGTSTSMFGWFKLTTEIGAGTYTLIDQADAGSNIEYRVDYEYNGGTRRLNFHRNKSGVADNAAQYTITLGTAVWHHIGLVYDGTNLLGYVNGTQQASVGSSGDGSGGISADTFAIGQRTVTGDTKASALIDEMIVEDKAWTAGQVTQEYLRNKSNSSVEDEYTLTPGTPNEALTLRIGYNRTSTASNPTLQKIMLSYQ